jgi:hypothetical protein
MEVFNFINDVYLEITNEIPNAYKQVNNLEEYEKSEYLHLLSELRFSNENLYAHDEDQPDYNTLQEDFYELMVNGLKFINYCDMIEYTKSDKLYNSISDVKTMYYKCFNNEL